MVVLLTRTEKTNRDTYNIMKKRTIVIGVKGELDFSDVSWTFLCRGPFSAKHRKVKSAYYDQLEKQCIYNREQDVANYILGHQVSDKCRING